MTDQKNSMKAVPEEERLFSVGEVCSTCQISRKTLFYYDRIGLLKPSVRRGPQNYKYYDSEALRRLHLIIRYRNAGISLKVIKVLLNSDRQSRLEILEGELKDAKKRFTTSQKQCEQIEAMIRETCEAV